MNKKNLVIFCMTVCLAAGGYAQQTDKAAPDSISLKILQFNPKGLTIDYLAPSDKVITQEGLTQDSVKLAKRINLYNKTQATPNGWEGKPVTAEEFNRGINYAWENFFIDKIRYYVATKQIPKPSDVPPKDLAQGAQIKCSLYNVYDKFLEKR